jgi:UDP:flavonoid glycosyltransferase YjiC (YdhE family)
MTWRLAKLLDQFNITPLINKKRAQLGLKPVQDAWRHIMGQHVLVASDKVIGEVPPDVSEPTWTQTGYMHLRQPDRDLPELDTFLEAGSPPVYAGFGSMPKKDQIRSLSIIVEAIRSCDRRAVIGKFWDEPSGFSNSDEILFIKKCPHLILFPHMAAVIHHGGAGTTASSAISGVPQIIVPHVLDQYYWANQVSQSKLGPEPIWRTELSSKKLAAAIQECLSDEDIRQKAKQASAMIKKQDSLEITVRELTKSAGVKQTPQNST